MKSCPAVWLALAACLARLPAARPIVYNGANPYGQYPPGMNFYRAVAQPGLQPVYNREYYCQFVECPRWKCIDDSAIIHGHCCGCPYMPGDKPNNIPVLCANDLKCPYNMNTLCSDYQLMLQCCCPT